MAAVRGAKKGFPRDETTRREPAAVNARAVHRCERAAPFSPRLPTAASSRRGPVYCRPARFFCLSALGVPCGSFLPPLALKGRISRRSDLTFADNCIYNIWGG